MKLSIEFVDLNGEYIARCPELDVNSYGSNKDEAIRRLINIIQFYVDSAEEVGLDIRGLDIVSIDGKPAPPHLKDRYYEKSGTIN